MPKKLKAFKLSEKNIATIKDHMDIIRVDNESMALRDILDNAHQYRSWLRIKILEHWSSLESLGVTIDNVRIVIPSLKQGKPVSKMSIKVKEKTEKMVGELRI